MTKIKGLIDKHAAFIYFVLTFIFTWGSIFLIIGTAKLPFSSEQIEDTKGDPTDFHRMLAFVGNRYSMPVLVAILSDFVGAQDILRSPYLRDLGARHDVVCAILDDPEEFEVPRGLFGTIVEENMETGETSEVWIRDARKRRKGIAAYREELKDGLSKMGIDSVELVYGRHIKQLTTLFAERRVRV